MSTYEAVPFTPTPARAEIVSHVLRSIAEHETLFTDYERICEERCMECGRCIERLRSIAHKLAAPDARVWEVWKDSEEVVGVLYMTRIIEGGDALAHYVFFDKDLRSKTALLEEMIQWAFTDQPGQWRALRRLTLEVPDFAYALARHAAKHLGFGGQYVHEVGGKQVEVEGVRRNAILWRSEPRDILVLGRIAHG